MAKTGGPLGLGRLLREGTVSGGDRALLEGFLARGDEAAFEALVDRHGPMVRGVCRRVLGSPQDVDDAFQATFLVLVQKAGKLRDADRLGPWLHGVATRVALRSRARSRGRRDRPGAIVHTCVGPDLGQPSEWADVRGILDAEMGRLPAKHREVLLLCLLDGLTAEQAASRLDCPVGTVKSRLARGREALRSRLVVRGIAPSVALAVASGSWRSASASAVPESLIRLTLGSIRAFGTSPGAVSSGVASLTRGVAPTMISKSTALAALTCGGLLLSGLGMAGWMRPVARAQEPKPAASATADESATTARRKSGYNFRVLGLALHTHYTAKDQMPPAAILGPDGRPNLSWRVALLPFLGQDELYHRFRLDEPWDSPHNSFLANLMPEVFDLPSAPAGPGLTRIQAFVGPGTPFDGPKGRTFAEIIDGLSNTLMFAAAAEAVPWTKPADLAFVPGQPLPSLETADAGGILVSLMDGSTRFISRHDEVAIRAAITRNGQEGPLPGRVDGDPSVGPPQSVPPPAVSPSPPGAAGAVMPAPAPASGPDAIEQRFRSLETKLDAILRKLDAAPSRKAGGLGP